MDSTDVNFMEEALVLADQCTPINESIPKVGAIIVAGGEVIGRGFRGSGNAWDDDYAELRAIRSAKEEDLKKAGSLAIVCDIKIGFA